MLSYTSGTVVRTYEVEEFMLSNIDFFNAFSLKLFDQLYRGFPSPIDIRGSDIASTLIPNDASDEDISRLYAAASDAISWLADERFIRFNMAASDFSGDYYGVVLSKKGLAVLNSSPEALSRDETIGSQIADLLRDSAKDVAKDEAKEQIRAGAARIMGYVVKVAAGLFAAT